MADTNEPNKGGSAYERMGQPAHSAPETNVGRKSSLGVELGIPLPTGQTAQPIQREPDHGLEVHIEGKDASLTRVDSSADPKDVKLGDDGKPLPQDDAGTDTTKPDDTQATAPEPLPEFDAAKPEAVEVYTKRFLSDDGKNFNMAALSADWGANAKTDPKTGEITGSLTEGVYKFLETKGVTREDAKAIEAGQVARIMVERQAIWTAAGGQEKYDAAIDWARKGGYDAAGQAKFNADLNAGGQARKDAIDLLMQRMGKANPARRQVSPARTTAEAANAGGGQGASGVKPYANYQEYQTDLREARRTNNQAKLDESRARLKASLWHTGG